MADRMCEGRIVVISGAGRGIGREEALMMAKHGAKIVVNDIGVARDGAGAGEGPAQEVVNEIKAMGGEAAANTSDISTMAGAKALIDQAVETFGGLDVVVNNAGILRDRMIVNMTESDWDAVMNVHLKGTFALTHYAANYWRERTKAGDKNDARIINTSSASGIFGNVGQANYGAAKAGIATFTIIASMELERYGVGVNAIAPKALTRMTEDLSRFTETEEIKAALDPRWIAPIVTWLASSESADVTGRVFDVTGQALSVAEGWHRGPTQEHPTDDPAALGEVVRRLVGEARPNANMFGYDEKVEG